MICIDFFKHCYYPILADVIVDYKDQVFISKINTNIQLHLSRFFSRKKEPNKIMAIIDIQIHIVKVWKVTEQSYKTIK